MTPEQLAGGPLHDAVIGVHAAAPQQWCHARAQALVFVGAGVEDLEALAHELLARGPEHLAQGLVAIHHGAFARQCQPHRGEVKGEAVVDLHVGTGVSNRVGLYAILRMRLRSIVGFSLDPPGGNHVNKIYPSAAAALQGIVADGQLLAVGGFGLCGIPEALIAAIRDLGVRELTAISNNAGVDGFGLGQLLATRQIRKMIASYVGENKEFERQYLAGELELEFTPQGTLAEKLRAGGAGIPGFYTRTGVGTLVAEGKEIKQFDGQDYILERSLVPDLSLVKADTADRAGNLMFRRTARNFNPNVAMAGRITVVEVEHLVETGELDPDQIHLPGIFVHRIVLNQSPEKRIEQRTIRPD